MCSHLILSILNTVKSKVILVCVCFQSLSCVPLFSTPWTVACQAPLSMGFPREEYCSGLPLSPPGDLPDSEMKPVSPAFPALAVGFFTTEPTENSKVYPYNVANSC